MLKKLNQIIHNPLLSDFQFIILLKHTGIIKRLQTKQPSFSIVRIGQKLGQAEQPLFLLEILFHIVDQAGDDAQAMQLYFTELGLRPSRDCVGVGHGVDIQQQVFHEIDLLDSEKDIAVIRLDSDQDSAPNQFLELEVLDIGAVFGLALGHLVFVIS
jgi:hypothetical protein